MPVGVKEGGPRSGGYLVERVRNGDMTAFAVLYRDNVGAVMRAVRDNVHDPESVADVTQEVFARALERLGTLRDPARFRPWLLSIARHAAIDHRRARKNVADSLDDAPVEPADTGRGPADMAELNELARFVRGCVAGLSRRDATALTLVTQFGLRPARGGGRARRLGGGGQGHPVPGPAAAAGSADAGAAGPPEDGGLPRSHPGTGARRPRGRGTARALLFGL